MGEAELQAGKHLLIIHSVIHIYGDAAGEDLSLQLAADIAAHWNKGSWNSIDRQRKVRCTF